MKAARFSRFGGPEVLEIADLPDPHAGPGQIRIAVRAVGVNASDRKKRSGQMDPELPQTIGYEAAGVVDEIGDGVDDVALGDRVYGFSDDGASQAELAVLSNYAPIPAALDFAGRQLCPPPSRQPHVRSTNSVSAAVARCSSAAPLAASGVLRSSSRWPATRV
ncbi:alcohol dehydrogenase catalytic domain-containing protein [Gordonia sp. SL306]|nr:alcohol dehydrogenase catalytic domain-containing protein [Gordonia sp. SL306]WAC55521.1 alcohol dehydrogenase catalytic domain-containing protein [Gordonia sp. SL306]